MEERRDRPHFVGAFVWAGDAGERLRSLPRSTNEGREVLTQQWKAGTTNCARSEGPNLVHSRLASKGKNLRKSSSPKNVYCQPVNYVGMSDECFIWSPLQMVYPATSVHRRLSSHNKSRNNLRNGCASIRRTNNNFHLADP